MKKVRHPLVRTAERKRSVIPLPGLQNEKGPSSLSQDCRTKKIRHPSVRTAE
jgi:hypothetical protein